MKQWKVAGALLERSEELLLVCNRRRGGVMDWTPPGGVIDEGEPVLDGLAREVAEETGLAVAVWDPAPTYRIDVLAAGLGWHLSVEVHRALDWHGELCVGADPDDIVIDARFVARSACSAQLAAAHQWVSEPLASWLEMPWTGTRQFAYEVHGASLAQARVERR